MDIRFGFVQCPLLRTYGIASFMGGTYALGEEKLVTLHIVLVITYNWGFLGAAVYFSFKRLPPNWPGLAAFHLFCLNGPKTHISFWKKNTWADISHISPYLTLLRSTNHFPPHQGTLGVPNFYQNSIGNPAIPHSMSDTAYIPPMEAWYYSIGVHWLAWPSNCSLKMSLIPFCRVRLPSVLCWKRSPLYPFHLQWTGSPVAFVDLQLHQFCNDLPQPLCIAIVSIFHPIIGWIIAQWWCWQYISLNTLLHRVLDRLETLDPGDWLYVA